MTEVGVLEARNNLSALIRQAKNGDDVVITSRGEPQVRLVPVQPEPERGSVAAIFAALGPITWRGLTHEQIEDLINEERNSWE